LFFADVTLHCSIGRAAIGHWSKGCQFVLRSTIFASLARSTALMFRSFHPAIMLTACNAQSWWADASANPLRQADSDPAPEWLGAQDHDVNQSNQPFQNHSNRSGKPANEMENRFGGHSLPPGGK